MADRNPSKFRSSLRVKLLLGIITVSLITWMFPKGESIESEVSEGSIWTHDDLIAPFSFPVKKDPDVYKAELKSAAKSVYPIFVKNDKIPAQMNDSLKHYDEFLFKIIDSVLTNDSLQNLNPTFLSQQSFETFKNLRRKERNLLVKKGYNLKILLSKVEGIINNVYKKGILDINVDQNYSDSIAVRTGNIDKIEKRSNIYDLKSAREAVKNSIVQEDFGEEVQTALIEYAEHFIIPNVILDPKLTEEEIEQAQNNVSKYTGIVTENERIIAKHDRITKEIKLKN